MTSTPVVFMDETGNKESDQFFICGFLEVPDVNIFQSQLLRIRDQIHGLSMRQRQERIKKLRHDKDIEQLYNLAFRPSSFELKYDKITESNLSLYQDLFKLLARKADFKFTAIVIDRKDSSYVHKSLLDMYKIITHKFFNHRINSQVIYMPDNFDTGLSWSEVVRSNSISAIVPIESHASLALQCCDLLGGIIGLALKDQKDYTKRDIVRSPLLKTFKEEFKCEITREFTVANPKYISVWTLDFSKVKK